jgi:hypothetical protein
LIGGRGGIIPQNAKTVPNGKYVYEFTSNKHTDSEGNIYRAHAGVLKTTATLNIFAVLFSRSWIRIRRNSGESSTAKPSPTAPTPTPTLTQTNPLNPILSKKATATLYTL